MNLRCSFCQTPFTMGRIDKLTALQHMETEKLSHYDVHCPRCRRATPVQRTKMELTMPNWRDALKELEADLKAHPQQEAPLPKPVAVSEPKTVSKPIADAKPKAEKKPAEKPKAKAKPKAEKKPAAKPAAKAKPKAEKKPAAKKPTPKTKAKPAAKKPATKKPASKGKTAAKKKK